MHPHPNPQGWYAFERSISPEAFAQLKDIRPIEKLALTKSPLVTVALAHRLLDLHIKHLWLWSDVTRRALRYIVQIPGLQVLEVLHIKGPGNLGKFSQAQSLEVFRANHCMSTADLLAVTQCSALKELGAQGAELTPKAFATILTLSQLRSLDLESTCFDDDMAQKLRHAKTIESLYLGATQITGRGLRHIAQMEQLRSLDLWATALTDDDLQSVLDMRYLEYISLGNTDGKPQLGAEHVCKTILQSSSIKRVWLDGIHLQAAQQEELEQKLETLRVT